MPENFLKAVCWTLVHSIWQGVMIAILGGVIILTTKKATANLRYNLLFLLFCFYLFVVGLTFVKQLSYDYQGSFSSSASSVLSNEVVSIPFTNNIPSKINTEGLTYTFNTFLTEHASLVVLVWFVFFMAQFLKLRSGMSYIRRLRKSSVLPSKEWKQFVQNLIEKVGVKECVVLMESPLINVPLTFGFLKSTILVPVGLLSNLPLDQVEAVLVHELAHIGRKDYLINLMQATAEAIFFFNPGILWLSSLIRQEREACCDDIVLCHTTQKQSYLEALVSFQEYSLGRSVPVIALSVKKPYLLNRIKRMLTKENQKLNTMEKTMLLIAAIAFTAFGFINKTKVPESSMPLMVQKEIIKPAFTIAKKNSDVPTYIPLPQQPEKKMLVELPKATITKDTLPNTRKNIKKQKTFPSVSTKSHDDGQTRTYEMEATDSEGKNYRLKKLNGTLTEFTVDGKNVETEKEEYAEILDQLEMLENKRGQRTKETEQKRIEEKQERIKERQGKQAFLTKQHEQRKREQKVRQEVQERNNIEQKKNVEQQKKFEKKNILERENQLKIERNYSLNMNTGNGTNEEINSIIKDLRQNNLISNTDAFSFSLNNNELIVNGSRQPSELHQSLKQKYIHSK